MRTRTVSLGLLGATIAAVTLAPAAVYGQARATTAAASAEKTYTVPRTPWGNPDLQGIWTNATITPLQRPDRFAGKEFLTEQEAATLEQEAAANRVDRAPEPGNVGTYNQLWFDRGSTVVSTRRSSLIVDPPDGKIPWTPEAAKANASVDRARGRDYWNDWTDLDTGERCLTDGLPHMPYAYNNNYQILQTPGYVVILHEMFNEIRVIPVDGSAHLDQNIRQWFGDSRGRWEGDTLVVDTTNFNDKTSYRWAASWRAPRPTLHIVERFTRVDEHTIDYRFTVEDPTQFSRPWTASVPMTTNQGAVGATVGEIYEYACHEGNYSMIHVLRGARLKEKQAAKP